MANKQIQFMITAVTAFCLLSGFYPVSDSKEIIVGGDKHWKFGFNYTQWAETAGPFFLNDILVFIYKPPSTAGIHVNHNVMLLHSQKYLEECCFIKSRLIADTSDGYPGFKFQLTDDKPYYFACGEARGLHCSVGSMRFMVTPLSL